MKKTLGLVMLAALVLASMPIARAADEGDKKFTIGLELRDRWENLNNYLDFNKDRNDHIEFWPYRALINVRGKLSNDVSLMFDVQNVGSFGNQSPLQSDVTGAGSPIFQDLDGDGLPNGFRSSETSLYQAAILLNKIGGTGLGVTVGRQEYNLATGMILGNEPFYNGIVFDGIKGVYDFDHWDLTGLVFRTTERNDIANLQFAGPMNEDENVYGLVGSFQFGSKTKSDLDGYVFNHQEQMNAPFQTRAWIYGANWRRMVQTVQDAKDNHWDWNAELAIETGTDEDPTGAKFDFNGWMFEGSVGYNFAGDNIIHRVHAGVVSQAGDDDLTDNTAHGWSGLFPTVHGRFGNADFFGANFAAFDAGITAVNVGWNMATDNMKHKAGVTFWKFMPTEDSIETGAGTVDIQDYGTEWDAWYKYMYSDNVSIGGGLAELLPDDGLTGGAGAPDDRVSRVYGMIRVLVP